MSLLPNQKGNERKIFVKKLSAKNNMSNPLLELKATPSLLPPSSTGKDFSKEFFAFESIPASKTHLVGGEATAASLALSLEL